MKDPAILFYTSDFISGTITMTDSQRGQYIMLLCLQHQKGYLTEKDMIKICNSYDEDIWCKFENEDGKYYNKRLKLEAEKRKNYAESRRNNRKGKVKDKKDMNNISKTYVPHMENININEDIVINKDNNVWIEKFKKDFSNTETIAMNVGISKSYLENAKKDFITLVMFAEPKPNYREFLNHFTNWAKKNISQYKAPPR